MNDQEQLKEIERLYRQAFAEYGAIALWNMRPVPRPTPGAALAITSALRTYGSMDGRRLAERIERLCRAAHLSSIAPASRACLIRRSMPERTMDRHDQLEEIQRLYRQAFAEYGAIALWSSRPVPRPTPGDALAITWSLRVEGDMNARRLAERIEQLCRDAAH